MNTKRLTILAVFIALTTVLTMQGFALPVGWFNFGDIVIFAVAAILGPIPGMIIGGIGAAMGDLLLGYAIYAPATLIIKGFYGYLIGKSTQNGLPPFVAFMFATLILVAGYFAYDSLVVADVATATGSVLGNLAQGLISSVFAFALVKALKNRIKY